jgi:hypothetical protein
MAKLYYYCSTFSGVASLLVITICCLRKDISFQLFLAFLIPLCPLFVGLLTPILTTVLFPGKRGSSYVEDGQSSLEKISSTGYPGRGSNHQGNGQTTAQPETSSKPALQYFPAQKPVYNMNPRIAGTPQAETVYPITPVSPPPYVPGEPIQRHRLFLCRAVQQFKGNPELGKRSVRRGELVCIQKTKTGWWWAIAHDNHGGYGWIPSMHLELYDPCADSSVYYDTLLPEKDRNPVYLFNPLANPSPQEELFKQVQKMLTDRKLRGKNVRFGYGFIEVILVWSDSKYDIASLPTVCGGFLVSYTVEQESIPKPCGHYTDEEWQVLEDKRKQKERPPWRQVDKGKED